MEQAKRFELLALTLQVLKRQVDEIVACGEDAPIDAPEGSGDGIHPQLGAERRSTSRGQSGRNPTAANDSTVAETPETKASPLSRIRPPHNQKGGAAR